VVKNKDGKYNFDDLLQAKDTKPAEPKKGAPEQASDKDKVKFDLAGVSIDRSSVAYKDLATGKELEISDLKLSTGRVAEKADGKLDLAASVRGKNPALDLKAKLSGDYQIDLPAKVYKLAKVDGELKGTLDKD